jgi:cytochrome d ubiquinol oxidase subunit II
MGPVWEANHIWLIILIVILFNGFPLMYTQYSIYFHVPLTLILIGIVFRGCAFTFRNYDAVKDDTHRYYSMAFSLSSLLTPIMFGMIMGGMFFGVDAHGGNYWQTYMSSWCNWPSLAIGIFVLSMFTYLANVYLIGETEDKAVKDYYIRLAQKTSVMMLVAGALVFVLAQASSHPLFVLFFSNPTSIACFIMATILTLVFWYKIRRGKLTEWGIRLLAGTQVGFILLAWLAVIFPNVLFYKDGLPLSIWQAQAPPVTINILAWSLIAGSLLFLPILFYLIRVFKVSGRIYA